MKTLDPKLIPVLEERYAKYWWPVEYPKDVSSDPFKNLVITVLSQNTSETNCVRAYRGLAERFEVDPKVLANADLGEIRNAIRSGGLYNIKSKRIKELSKLVLEEFKGDLAPILALPKEKAKKRRRKGSWSCQASATKPQTCCSQVNTAITKCSLWTRT